MPKRKSTLTSGMKRMKMSSDMSVIPLPDAPGTGDTPGTQGIVEWGRKHNYWGQLGHSGHSAWESGGLPGGVTPMIQAMIDPFSKDALIRIPDSCQPSFCLPHTGTCVTVTPSQGSAMATGTCMYTGFALRPSAADGSQTFEPNTGGAPVSVTQDAWLIQGTIGAPIGALNGVVPGTYPTKGGWFENQLVVASPQTGITNIPTYYWATNVSGWDKTNTTNGTSAPLNMASSAPSWISKITGFLTSYGTKMRPTSWAIWLETEGLNDTSTGQVVLPAGRVYYGVRNTVDNTGENYAMEAGSGSVHNVLVQSVDAQTIYDVNGPTLTSQRTPQGTPAIATPSFGVPWDEPSVNNDLSTELLGSMSMVQLDRLEHGFIISASITGNNDAQWRDVAYWTGQNRFFDPTNFTQAVANQYVPASQNYFDLVGLQPFIWYEGGINMKMRWRFTVNWECQSGQSGYTLPGGAIGRAKPDRGQFDEFVEFMNAYQGGARPILPTTRAIALHKPSYAAGSR